MMRDDVPGIAGEDYAVIHIHIPKIIYVKLKKKGYSISSLARILLIKKASEDPNVLMDGFTFRQCMESIGVSDYKAMRQWLTDLFDVPDEVSEDYFNTHRIISRNGEYELVGNAGVFDKTVRKIYKEV